MPTKTRSRQKIERHIEAMAHPVRHRAWVILHRHEASPKEIADEIGQPTPNVSHHIKRLVKLGCAELVREEKVRGTIRHVYKATEPVLLDVEDWELLVQENPPFARHVLCSAIQEQIDDLYQAVATRNLGSDDIRWWISRTPTVLDDEGLEEALALARKAEDDLGEIIQRSAARRSADGSSSFPVSVFFDVFKSAPR